MNNRLSIFAVEFHEHESQLTATQCNTLQHTLTHCNTLRHTTTHCNTLQHNNFADEVHEHKMHAKEQWLWARHVAALQHTAPHYNTLQHTIFADEFHENKMHAKEQWLWARHVAALQHAATHCNTLQHTTTHCNTPFLPMNSMSTRCMRRSSGFGHGMLQACMRDKLRNSFSAHIFTIFRGLLLLEKGKKTSV